jgi:hypothetical protein
VTSIDQGVWSNLTRPSGDVLVARLALPEITNRLHCALDSKGHKHLLVSLRPQDNEYNDSNSRGLNVVTRELAVRGQLLERYLDIECLDITGHAIFDLIGGEIADELRDEAAQPIDSVQRVLARWRRFWGHLPQQILSREQQMGLFAELWFLVVWLVPKFGPDVIMMWRGPWGSRHDFEWTDKSVEVKATTNTRGRIFKIHGLSQLERPLNGPLYLFSLCVREEGGSSNNLPYLIDSCYNQIKDLDEVLVRFESALVQIGYSPVHRDEYAKLNLRIIEERLFHVDGDFPRLTNLNFQEGVPSGVERIEYEINLNTFNHLVLAGNPEQLPFI